LRDHPGGVALLAINADRDASHELTVPGGASRYTLTAKDLLGTSVALNGRELKMGPNDTLPPINGEPVTGTATLPPTSITFLAFPKAINNSCR
jgi:hypothetical protein